MITVTMSADERALSYNVLAAHAYTFTGQADVSHIARIRSKLDKGTDTVSFTDKEANVLMDALANEGHDEGGDLAERLTGRV